MSWSRVVKILKVACTAMVLSVAVGVALITVVIPRATGSTSLTVLTGSMSPTIPAGSVVLVKPLDPEKIEVGDVITFQAAPGEASYITHRVIEIDTDGSQRSFVTQGDANRGPDLDSVPAGAVRGRVLFHVPVIGEIADTVRTPTGLLLLVGLPCGFYVLAQGREVLGDLRKRKTERGLGIRAEMPAEPGWAVSADGGSIERALLMATVATDPAGLTELISVTSAFGGTVVQMAGAEAVVTLVDDSSSLDQFEVHLKQWPEREVMRSNVVSLRGTGAPRAADAEEAELGEADPEATPGDAELQVIPSPSLAVTQNTGWTRLNAAPAPIRYPRDLDIALELELALEDERPVDA